MKISQVGSIAEGALAGELVRRVLARFPDLYEPSRPTPDTITGLLKNLGYDVTRGSDSRLHLWPSTQVSGTSGPRGRTPARLTPSTATAEAAEHAIARLTQARQRGGFIALKAPDPRRRRDPRHGPGLRRRHRRQRHDRVRPGAPRGRRRAGPPPMGDRPRG